MLISREVVVYLNVRRQVVVYLMSEEVVVFLNVRRGGGVS
jgi:hypothetical protein